MKNFIKTPVILAIVSCVLFINCQNENQDLTKDNKISLISPNGFVIAESLDELKSSLNIKQNEKVTEIEYVESDKYNVAYIKYRNVDGIDLNYAIASGNLNFETNKLITNASKSRSQLNKKWKISCGGCENCRVGGTLDMEGNMTFQCESSCCELTVEELTKVE
ncbi:MAG: hypothetical protein ACJA2M_001827 [Polaribacter sp.]|jgi:hypothetical protein